MTVVPGWKGRSGRKLLEEQSGGHGMGQDAGEEAESYQDMKGGDKRRGEQLRKCFHQHVIMKYLKKEQK